MAVNREGASNPMQKGERRQRLHEHQNNIGDSKKQPDYKSFDGTPIK